MPTKASAAKANTPPIIARGQVRLGRRPAMISLGSGCGRASAGRAGAPCSTTAVVVTTASPISRRMIAAGKNQGGSPSLSMKTSVTSRIAQEAAA